MKRLCVDIYKQTESVYDIKGKEKTLSMYEKKETERDSYVHIYECDKQLCTLTFKCICVTQEMTISQITEMLESFNYETKELRATNQDLNNYIDSFHKESERSAEYLEQSTTYFDNVANITIVSDSIPAQKKQNGRRKIVRKTVRFFDKNDANNSINGRKQFMEVKQLNQTRAIKLINHKRNS